MLADAFAHRWNASPESGSGLTMGPYGPMVGPNEGETKLPIALAGKGVAVVTGGASGIGRAVCHALARSGVRRVVVADLHGDAAEQVASAINAAQPDCCAEGLELDVGDGGAVETAVAQIERELGHISLWCSNAGIHTGEGLGTAGDWQTCLTVNLMGHVNAAEAVIPRMVSRRGGHFVITASAAGLLTDFRCAPYAASKHAAVALAEWLAITHADDGIAVSCVCPEGVRTAMTRPDSLKAGAAGNFLAPEQVADDIIEALASRRFLVLPHPRVAEYEQHRAADREHWLERMRAARRRLMPAAPSAAAS
jgi:NAD(P)-dependent dehydrogenase (short-subunit alcohol dehydrogenase family)